MNSPKRVIVTAATGMGILIAIGVVYWIWTPTPAQQYEVGWTSLQVAEFSQTSDVADRLAKWPGFESHSHLLRGGVLLRRGKLRESLDELRLALNHDQTRVRAQVLAGEALTKLKLSLNAAEVLREAVGSEPGNVEAHRWAGAALYDLGAMEPAVFHLERLAELVPTDPRPHRVMGLIYKDLENDQKAVRCYEASLARSVDQPDIESIRTELAEVQIRLNHHADALKTLASCTSSSRVLASRAECEYAQGNVAAASDLLNTALKQNPADEASLLLQGTIALNEGRPKVAIAAFEQVVKQSPADFTARFKLSQAYAQAGEEQQAARQLEVMNEIKEIRREVNQVYQQALGQPRDADARFRLGVLSEKLNRSDLARMWYQAALSIDANHAPAATALKNLRLGE